MSSKPKFRRVGWVGLSSGEVHFNVVNDEYSKPPEAAEIADILKTRREALKRYEAITAVFIRKAPVARKRSTKKGS